MRSWRSGAAAMLVVVAACGNDLARTDVGRPDGFTFPEPEPEDPEPEDPEPLPAACATSYLDYDNFGAPFVTNWCRGCHGSDVPMGMRQKAPLEVNFDTVEQVREWQIRIAVLAGTGTMMPPSGGPTAEERALLVEWLDCGAKE